MGKGFFGDNVLELCQKADIVFMGLHGSNGEDGKIQAAFELMGIKYTGTDYISSAISMSKELTKKVLVPEGIPMPKGIALHKGHKVEYVPFPCVVKPCCGGSSVGVSIVNSEEEFKRALTDAFSYEDNILVEEFIKGREFSVGVLNGKALPVIEIEPLDGFYDYKNKYKAGATKETCPANLPKEISEKMQRWAEKACETAGVTTYARVDELLNEDGDIYCLEINTLPGMTGTSLLPQEAAAVGMSYDELTKKIIEISLESIINIEWRLLFMRGMTLRAIAEACNGVYYGSEDNLDKEVTDITTDSRKVQNGGLFVAICGERTDGHQYIDNCFNDGALCVISEKELEGQTNSYIKVKSSLQALKDMALLYRNNLDIKVVGITGSVGKTSTKETISYVLNKKYKVLKTEGNFNNEIGLPLTVFRLRDDDEVAVLEMGISDFGEMDRLSKLPSQI